LKETAGVVSGDRELEAEGKADMLKCNVKEKAEDAKRAIKDAVDPDRRDRREEP
jgi:uncharacterized protein YjbJ (UPF0337 family)